MLINSLIVIGFLLSFMCFAWFFVFNRYLSKKRIWILFLDSILIILTIGTFSTGFFLRDSYLKAGRKNGTGKERGQAISVGEEAEPSYTPLGFTYPKTGGEKGEKEIFDMNTEEKTTENEKVPDSIRQERGTAVGISQPETELRPSVEPSAEVMPPSGRDPQPGTESSMGVEMQVSTETSVSSETPVEQVSPANVETPPETITPVEAEAQESEISQEMEGDLNGGQGDMAQPDQGEVQAPNPEETGQ